MSARRFTLTIDCDNAAFGDTPEDELAAILTAVRNRLMNGRVSGVCMDANGNKVGEWEISE